MLLTFSNVLREYIDRLILLDTHHNHLVAVQRHLLFAGTEIETFIYSNTWKFMGPDKFLACFVVVFASHA